MEEKKGWKKHHSLFVAFLVAAFVKHRRSKWMHDCDASPSRSSFHCISFLISPSFHLVNNVFHSWIPIDFHHSILFKSLHSINRYFTTYYLNNTKQKIHWKWKPYKQNKRAKNRQLDILRSFCSGIQSTSFSGATDTTLLFVICYMFLEFCTFCFRFPISFLLPLFLVDILTPLRRIQWIA